MTEHDDDTEQEQESPGKGLRAQLEQALADKKTLEGELNGLRAKVRQAEVSNVLSTKGVNSKIAKFIPADVEGEEGIAKWLEENADVFGFQTQEDGTSASQEQEVDPEVKQSAQRMQNLGSNASSPSKLADLESRMKQAQTADELQQLWGEAQKFML